MSILAAHQRFEPKAESQQLYRSAQYTYFEEHRANIKLKLTRAKAFQDIN